MTTFAIGEIAIGQFHVACPQYNGTECEIIGPLEFRRSVGPISGKDTSAVQYRVQWASGEITTVRPHQLRKKRPPESDESAARQAMLDCIERAKMPVEVES